MEADALMVARQDRQASRAVLRAAATVTLGVLGVALAVLLALPEDGYWINDCGNKALVAKRLLETGYGELSFDQPARAVDSEGRAFPIVAPFAITRSEGPTSIYPPAYAALSAPLLGAFGPDGLRLPAAFGLALCAGAMVLWLAPAFGLRWAMLAGVLLALATPLFFYGLTVWEHTLTVAAGLIALVLLARDTPRRCLAAGFVLASACWLREELALQGLAVALAASLCARSLRPAGWLALGAALPAAALLVLNAELFGNPLGPHLAASRGAGAAASGLTGGDAGVLEVVVSLLAGVANTARERGLLAAAALSLPLAGWFVARRERGGAAMVVAITAPALVAWAFGFWRMLSAELPLAELVRYNGLLTQLPAFALAGHGAGVISRRAEFASLRLGVLAGLLLLGSTLLAGGFFGSGYAVQAGFGVHWGPRVLLPAVPALVAAAFAAVLSVLPGAAGFGARLVRTAAVALALAGLASTGLSVCFLAQQRGDAVAFQDALRSLPSRYVIVTHPLLAQHVSGLWDERPMLLATNPAALGGAVAGILRSGVRGFTFVAPPGAATVSSLPGASCRSVTQTRGRRLHYFDFDLLQCRGASQRGRARPRPSAGGM